MKKINRFNLVGELRDFCNKNNIFFVAGENDYVNATIQNHKFEENELVMRCWLELRPNFGGSVVQSVQYNGMIALGRKREEYTCSNLDETFLQKYDARLLQLTEYLVGILREFSCGINAEINSLNITYSINDYDENIDFVAGQIAITI